MKVRWNRTVVIVAVAASALVLGACGKKEVPPPPAPVEDDGAAERARREAEERAAAERARREAEARAAEEAVRAARARATLEEMVFFDYDQATIRGDARTALDAKVPLLRESPMVRLRIVGHADERGSTEYNLALGMRRAQSIKDYLAGYGIAADRLDIQSMGEERPLVRASNEEAWSRNRRGEFSILAGMASRDH